MKTEIQESELYKKFKKTLGIGAEMRVDDNPFVVECCKVAEEYAQQFKSQLESAQKEIERLKGSDNAWPLQDVLTKLVDASDYLLHRKDYDGHGHEELLHCVIRGKEIISQLKPQ